MSRLQMAFFELKKRVFFEIALIIGLTLSFFFAANAFGISKNEKMNSRRAEYFASFDYLKTATLFEPKRANNKYLSVDELDAIDPKAALSKHLNCFVSGADNLQTFKINPAAAELLPLYDLQEGAAYVSRRLKRYFPTGVIKLGFHSFDGQTHTESWGACRRGGVYALAGRLRRISRGAVQKLRARRKPFFVGHGE